MKKSLLLLLLCTVLLYACQKQSSSNPNISYALSAVVDGKFETFTTGDSVRLINASGAYITGLNDTTGDRLVMIATNSAGFGVGTYIDTSRTSTTYSQMLLYPAGNYNSFFYAYISGTHTFPCTITVTSATSKNVQGTFSGNIVLTDYIGGTAPLKTKTITNGKFNINIK